MMEDQFAKHEFRNQEQLCSTSWYDFIKKTFHAIEHVCSSSKSHERSFTFSANCFSRVVR